MQSTEVSGDGFLHHAAERSERARLERENAKLLAKAFEAPSTALLEVRNLTSEVYSLRCEKANAELREAEARREVASLISQVGLCAVHLLSLSAADHK